MKTVNMHEAKTHLSKLVAKAVAGEPFVIARAGKPLVKVSPVEEETKKPLSRLGFMADQEHNWTIPDDFDTLMQDEMIDMFYGEGDGQKFAGLDFPFPKPGDEDQRRQRPAGRQNAEQRKAK